MLLPLLFLFGTVHGEISQFQLPSPWTYTCDRGNSSIGGHYVGPRCIKGPSAEAESVTGLNECKLTCGNAGMVWPMPTEMSHSDDIIRFIPQDLEFRSVTTSSDTVGNFLNKFIDIFREYLYMKNPAYEGEYKNPFENKPYISTTKVLVHVTIDSPSAEFNTQTDESYSIDIAGTVGKVGVGQNSIRVDIRAQTYFGARSGLETLSQMIAYDDVTDSLMIYSSAQVLDRPAFPHRGVLVDTSRNFVKKQVLLDIISGMSYDKLNVFHWHITDTHSFPMYSRRVPQLTYYGAYSARKVYSPEDIKEIVEYAKVRGVRVLPEFDAPAHAGNGWQFGEKEGRGRLAVCINQEPWQDYCVEPPCGQLNPVNPNLYPTLGKLYADFFEMFETDMFHMGGDEVNLNCWNTTTEIREYLEGRGETGTEAELLALWKSFQLQAAEQVYEAADKRVPVIIWTSRLTENDNLAKTKDFLPTEDYIIQIWAEGNDESISSVINGGYRTIFSNSDAWYLDCGYSAWVGEGNNWCSPYKGWQKVYDNSPRAIYREQGGLTENEALILGGEAAMWSEQVDGAAIMHKLWPRLSALGERLWSDPETDWKQAEIRMTSHRENLLDRGITADGLQPEWCNQNEGLCYVRV